MINKINQVDIVKAETEVKRLQAQYPHETPRLSPTSLAVIEENIESPPALKTLLEKVKKLLKSMVL